MTPQHMHTCITIIYYSIKHHGLEWNACSVQRARPAQNCTKNAWHEGVCELWIWAHRRTRLRAEAS